MSRRIEIIVTLDGQMSVHTLGFSGPSCREASKFLEEALGRRLDERRTAEFYQAQQEQQNAKQRS